MAQLSRVAGRLVRSLFIAVILVAVGLQTPVGFAQAPPASFEPTGLQPKRGYFGQFGFERIDMILGNLNLVFEDLVLPGNAGMDLRLVRAYTRSGGAIGLWRFGIAGVPVRIGHPTPPDPAEGGYFYPELYMGDGSLRRMMPVSNISSDTEYVTPNFWRFSTVTRRLQMDNGWTATYEQGNPPGGVMLVEVHDPYGNSITPTWEPPFPAAPDQRPFRMTSVQQTFGGDSGCQGCQKRTVSFTYGDAPLEPATMVYSEGNQTRTWAYAYDSWGEGLPPSRLRVVSPPVGPTWRFDYPASGLKVTMPSGGWVEYDIVPLQSPDDWTHWTVATRTTGGPDIVGGTWQFHYDYGTRINHVDGPNGRRVEYRHAWFTTSEWLLTRKTLLTNGGGSWAEVAHSETDYEERRYREFSAGAAVASEERIFQDGNQYTTTYGYRPDDAGNHYSDYHRPATITEVGDLARVTALVYEYSFGDNAGPIKRVQSQTVTVDGQSFTTSYEHEFETGFMNRRTVNGVPTSFSPDLEGNVATATDANGKVTSWMYSWGVQEDVATPEYPVERQIDPDGTVAWSKQRGLTTNFSYDALGRLTGTSPPLGESVSTQSDPDFGRFVRVSRGSTWTHTVLDGFGRPIRTENSAGVHTRTEYDADGRRVYQSYPHDAVTAEQGDWFEFDALGRVTKVTHPAAPVSSFVQTNYGTEAVTIIDEEGRTTEQRWRAFGNPSDARLMSVVDPHLKVWNYSYTVLGALRGVDPPDVTDPPGSPPNRTWNYEAGTHRLLSDSQPESGTTSYDLYDGVGNLKKKTDALSRVIQYVYDGNNRLTTIDAPGTADDVTIVYDASDNRTRVTTALVDSEFSYDDANRLLLRKDTISGRVFQTRYEYNSLDMLTAVVYPSGRRVEYAPNPATGRIVGVIGQAGVNYATDILYHPSGAIRELKFGNSTAGNIVKETVTFDERQRPEYLTSGPVANPLDLTYTYDFVGNVIAIADGRGSSFSSQFTYDSLDRLTFVTDFGAREYRYDELGNRTKKIAGGEITYQYDIATQRLVNVTGGAPEGGAVVPDAAGNTTSDPAGTYTYTPFNLMATATTGGPGGGEHTYGYDGDNQRKRKQGPDGVRYYIHGPGGQLLAEYRDTLSGPELVREYIYLGSKLIASSARVDPPTPTGRVTGVTADPQAQKYGLVVTLTVTGWTTPCSQVQVNFGDGTVTPYTIASPYQLPLQVTHTYAAAGLYTVVATGQTGASGPCLGTISTPVEVTSGNVVTNGNFAQVDGNGHPVSWGIFSVGDPAHWSLPQPAGSGILFHRTGNSTQAVVLQYTGLALGTGAPLEVTFTMGNTDTVRKRLLVLVHNSTFEDLSACSFWLDAAQSPATAYTMRMHTTQAWTNASVAFYAADANAPSSQGDYHLNNVTLTHRPAGNSAKTECVDPMMPASNGEWHWANLLYDEDFVYGWDPQWWTFTGHDARWNAGSVVGEVYRKNGGTAPTIQQPIRDVPGVGPVGAAGRVQVTFELRNASTTRQRVNITIQNDDPSDPRQVVCTFWLAPSPTKRLYAITTHTATGWPNGRLIVAPQTVGAEATHGWIQLDAVRFRKTNRAMLGTECYEPGSFLLDSSGFLIPDTPQAPAPAPLPAPDADALAVAESFRYAGYASYAGSARSEERADAPRLRSGLAGQLWASAGDERITVHAEAEGDESLPTVALDSARTDPLTVMIGGTSSGTVTSSPAGITCAGSTASCTGWFAEGTSVTLTATPDPGLVFVGWAGACTGTAPCSVTVTGPQSVTAIFGTPVQFYHLDVLGSVRMVTDAAGAVVKRHDYFAFGEDTAALTGDPRRFTGKELDPETALHYFGARYYRNLSGRFTTVDPVFSASARFRPQLWNRYAYALNAPLRYSDPTGLDPEPIEDAPFDSGFEDFDDWIDYYFNASVSYSFKEWVDLGRPSVAAQEQQAKEQQAAASQLHLDPGFIAKSGEAWRMAGIGTAPQEAGFFVFGAPGAYRFGDIVFTNEAYTQTKVPVPRGAVAYVHTHPNTRALPRKGDGDAGYSAKARMPYYVLTNRGLFFHPYPVDGSGPQELRPGLSWLRLPK